MESKDRKVLAAAVAVMLVLGTSSGASAISIANLGWSRDAAPSQLQRRDLSVSVLKVKELIEEKRQERREAVRELVTRVQNRIYYVADNDRFVAAAPEPSAALVFGLGLLVASRLHRRKR